MNHICLKRWQLFSYNHYFDEGGKTLPATSPVGTVVKGRRSASSLKVFPAAQPPPPSTTHCSTGSHPIPQATPTTTPPTLIPPRGGDRTDYCCGSRTLQQR